ncbi:hypothetical protein X975_15250, partial [Stegodyphus mimosarum]
MNKALITGASGLLGRAIVNEFLNNSWEVLGLAFSRARDKLIKVDLNNMDEVKEIIQKFKPTVIIHCAAQRSVEKVEKDYEESKRLNVACSKNLADLAKMENAVFLYISTDYVFDGKHPPYKENDEPNPLNQYGKTKLEGEKKVMNVNPDSCILRIPVLYGDEEYIGESAISSLIKNLKQQVPTKLSNAEIRFPSHTNDIASIIFQLIQCKLKDTSLNSVFHWCGLEPFTKYEMAKIIAEEFSISFSHIIPDETPSSAPRPKNVQLSCDRLKKIGISQ